MAKLRIVEGNDKNKTLDMDRNEITLGRMSTCDLVLTDLGTSRRHARILRINGGFYIEDTASVTGTYVNGRRITERILLHDRDVIQLGGTVIHFEAEQAGVPAMSHDVEAPVVAAMSLADPIARAEKLGIKGEMLKEIAQLAKQPNKQESQVEMGAPPQDKGSMVADGKDAERFKWIESEKANQSMDDADVDRWRREHARDRVQCSVFAPPWVPPGDSFLVQVFQHTELQARIAAQLAREFDEQAERRGFKSLETLLAHGTKLTFHLVMPGLEVDDPIQHQDWRGNTESVQFSVTVPENRKPGTVIGTVAISHESVPLGHIKFKLVVTVAADRSASSVPAPAGVQSHRYRKAFISYASADRSEVLKRVQMLSQLGIEFFQDVLDLAAGTRWEKELYRHIDESDLFLLFWSSAARQSKWVLEEVRYALNRKGADELNPPEIRPVVIEGPPPPAPPDELAHLHFNDYLMYFIVPGGRERCV